MGKTLEENTVQHTLCMPLCGRMITARKYPGLFPDRDAERIVRELGEGLSGRAILTFRTAAKTGLLYAAFLFAVHQTALFRDKVGRADADSTGLCHSERF